MRLDPPYPARDAAGYFMGKTSHKGHLTVGQRIGLIALPPVCLVICLIIGRMLISPGDVFGAVFSRLGLAAGVPARIDTVIWSMRLPRLILATAVGAGLSVSGCTFQGLFSNPLATPDTLGVASGASFGAALALLFGFGLVGVQLTAFGFGLLAVGITALVGTGLENRNTPILAGIMVGSLFSALVSLVKFVADAESQLPAITYWLMGSMESAGYRSLLWGIPPILLGTVILLLLRWRMNLLPLSPDEAITSGVDLAKLRFSARVCATMITASCVSMCGQVGWVGLLVPHICRMRFGDNNEILLPASVSIGASFMMLVDTAARSLSPKEIPISILTAILGAPVFIYLLRRSGRWGL